MFTINREVEYAIGFLKELSKLELGEYLSLRKFAATNNYSLLFLQKVARALRQAGIIASEKGSNGGYLLVENPDTINLKMLIEVFEGPCGVAQCQRGQTCPIAKSCGQKKGMGDLQKEMMKMLEGYKLKDL